MEAKRRRPPSRRRVPPSLAVILAAALAGPAGPAAAGGKGKLRGDPAATGVIAIFCEVRIVDLRVETAIFDRLFGESGPRSSPIMCRPWLVRADRPGKRIGPRKEGDLFFFSGLEPGTYRLDVLYGVAHAASLPTGGPESDIRELAYFPSLHEGRLLSVTVAPGDVHYFGRITVFDARFNPGPILSGDHPPVRTVLALTLADRIEAASLLEKAAGRSPWAGRIAEARRSAESAAPPDTTLEW